MAEDWNFYFAQVDGAVASVFVDLAHGAGAVDPTRPVVAWVSLKMRTPRADGLSSAEEAEMLYTIGDLLAVEASQHGALFVGRVTHSGLRDFFFYVPEARQAKLIQGLHRRVDGFSTYAYDVGKREDPNWAIYREYLYPDAYGLRQINDNKVIIRLQEHGDDPANVRAVDFDFAMPDAAAGDALVAWASLRAFTVTDRIVQAGGEVIYLQREQNLLSIRDDLNLLYEQAEAMGGALTGWGTVAEP